MSTTETTTTRTLDLLPGTLKPSEAIRVGSRMIQATQGAYLLACASGRACGCAVGAAMAATLGVEEVLRLRWEEEGDDFWSLIEKYYPALTEGSLDCPVCSVTNVSSGGLAEHLFERHSWRLPRIADHLEALGY